MPWAPSHTTTSVWRMSTVHEAQSEPRSGLAFGRGSPQTKEPYLAGEMGLAWRGKNEQTPIIPLFCPPILCVLPGLSPPVSGHSVRLPAGQRQPVVVLGM